MKSGCGVGCKWSGGCSARLALLFGVTCVKTPLGRRLQTWDDGCDVWTGVSNIKIIPSVSLNWEMTMGGDGHRSVFAGCMVDAVFFPPFTKTSKSGWSLSQFILGA